MNNIFLRVPLQEKILFTKNLALTLKSGVSLVNSLALLKRQAKSPSLKKILDSLIRDAESVNIIKIAEVSGTLPENLLYLGGELQKQHDLRRKVKGALVYPVIILIATVVIAVTMVVFVFPKILPLFQNAKVELPFTTRLLIVVSKLVSDYGILLFVGAVALIVGFRLFLKLKSFRFAYNIALSYLPIVGRSIVNYNMANFTRTLALLLRSGVKIIEALAITSRTTGNLVYRRELEKSAEYVRTGEFLSKYLSQKPKRFPALLANMIEVGENTGNLNDNLFYLAEYYENEVDDFVKNLSNILEPILLLFMGGIVGFIALSFITPIYQLTKSFQ